MSRLPRVYLAGKIGKHDWRHGLFDVSQSWDQRYRYDRARDVVEVIRKHPDVRDGFEYAGPYFLSDDHGCFHGQSQHGLIDPGYADGPGDVEDDWPTPLSQQTVMRSCLAWINAADVVFCWLDARDAYGTLVELGYAHARGIPVFLSWNKGIQSDWDGSERSRHGAADDEPQDVEVWQDFWFVREMSTLRWPSEDSHDAWRHFVRWWSGRGWSPDGDRRRLLFVGWKP